MPGAQPGLDAGRRHLVRFALVCLWTALGAGLLGAILHTPLYPLMHIWGLQLQALRPLHLAAGTGWIYLGGLAVVVHHWSASSSSAGAARTLKFFLATWALGALIVASALAVNRFAGREYFFISTPASACFWIGWVALWVAFLRTRPDAGSPPPVYLWMWVTSFGLFTYAFVETHVFLLPYFQAHPLRDMALEWKSYGTLVGSFNLLVYGALAYLGEQLNPHGAYTRSRAAFALFWIGVLNSFTNYGHHTYHLPQSSLVKWTSFTVSMTEIAILAKVVADTFGWARRRRRAASWDAVTWLLFATTAWTLSSLIVAIAISIPPLNSLIHGTLIVAGHAMGSMLGIDTMALLAVLGWIHLQDRGGRLPRWPVAVLNLGILLLWVSFLTVGAADGIRRWESGVLPTRSLWPAWFGPSFLAGGLLTAVGILALTWSWVLPLGPSRTPPPATQP